MTRPTRYRENNSSRDWIDEFCATKSVDEVRGAFLFNLGKYQRRYGKKDDQLQEALKIQDYANRLVEYERSLVKPIIRELYTAEHKQALFEGHEVDTDFDSEKERMPAIGTNGNDGGHYTPTLPIGYSWADAPPDATVLVMASITGRCHWADAFSDGARIYGAQFERMGLTRSSGWKLVARRPGSDPGWVKHCGNHPNLPLDMELEVQYHNGERHRAVAGIVKWRNADKYRVVEALEQ